MKKVFEEAGKLIKMAVEKSGELFGEGDNVAAVYNDCILSVSVIDGQIKIEITEGAPYVFDKNLLDDISDGAANG